MVEPLCTDERLSDLLRKALAECSEYNKLGRPYRFMQQSMRSLEARGMARRTDSRKRCAWVVTDVGQKYLWSVCG